MALSQLAGAVRALIAATPAPSSRKGADALSAVWAALEAVPCPLGGTHHWPQIGVRCTKCEALPPALAPEGQPAPMTATTVERRHHAAASLLAAEVIEACALYAPTLDTPERPYPVERLRAEIAARLLAEA